MLYKESIWFKQTINKYCKPNSLVLNIGSSTKEFLTEVQPYIHENVISPIIDLGCTLKNIDLKQAEGVDLVGDVTNPEFINSLKLLKPSLIICANLLEHLEDRQAFIDGLKQIIGDDTLLIVSVPLNFPFHADPIDTLYRPTLGELAADFSGLCIVEGKEVSSGLYYNYTTKGLNIFTKIAGFIKVWIKLLIAKAKADHVKFDEVLWNFKTISTTCVVFKKP
jgi:SAM-dependent methyltransferase